MASAVQRISQLYINGQWVAPSSNEVLEVVNPANEQVFATVPLGKQEDVDRAVRAARTSFDSGVWSSLTGAQRATYLRKISQLVTQNKASLARLEAMDCGKPLPEAEWDMDDVANCFEYYAKAAEELDGRQYTEVKLGEPRFKAYLRYEPVGVAALIIPWNYPLLMATWKVAPSLAAGCSVVLKPSELTPMTAFRLAELVHEAGFPPGVFNLVSGTGVSAGQYLSSHPLVDKIAFTGSVPTGQRVMTAAASGIRNVSLELGGKSALIVFDDVDIDKAVEWAMFGCFWTNGQICSATSRLLVHRSIEERLLRRLAEECQRVVIGDPLQEDNLTRTGMLGPLVSDGQYKKVTGMVREALHEGATLLAGGRRPPHLPTGYFLEPTVLKVTPEMKIWREEVFGPVLSVMTFDSEEDALRLANDSEFGLAGAVMSNDQARCDRVARRLRCGIVWVNCSQPCFCELPWGGIKKSGIGRELGPFGLENYLEVKQITHYVSQQPWGWYIKSQL